MDVPDKVNGDTSNETNEGALPKLQRKLKINRRSYHLANSLTSCLSTDQSNEKDSTINGSDGTIDKTSKAVSTQKRIISLSSIKSTSGKTLEKNSSDKGKDSSSIIVLKKTPITFTVDKKENPNCTLTASSSDPPPKKKHKPITWP